MKASFEYLDFQVPMFFHWPEKVKYKVVTKGRRTGATKGASNAIIEILLEKDGPILWGETVNQNIDRYYQQYFVPELKRNQIDFHWDTHKRQLTITDQFCDFRSADRPENWEGFGYKYIFLNEAGIILKNRDLYTKTVLPMMLDYPDSKLIAAGVPKGKYLRDGSEHPFYTLKKRAEEGNEKYMLMTMTSYDNPLLSIDSIRELEQEIGYISPTAIRQEIYGEFLETDAINPFAHHFSKDHHVSERAVFQPDKRIILSIDFNLQPFACQFSHFWEDSKGYHDHTFDEIEIKNGSIPHMAEEILLRYKDHLHKMEITGDYMGNRGDIGQRDNASLYMQLLRKLNISKSQLKLRPNPLHKNSKVDCNEVFWKSSHGKCEFLIHPKCTNSTFDLQNVQWDDLKEEIIKRDRKSATQRGDYLDCTRYRINTYWKPILKRIP